MTDSVEEPFATDWDKGFAALMRFIQREGHCRVPQRNTDDDGYRLGQWVQTQRSTQAELTDDRLRCLDEQGFVWDMSTWKWDEGFRHLKKFWERENHCRVPQRNTDDDGYPLGQWVQTQRSIEAELIENRRRRLNELGFVWKARNTQ